MSESLSIPISVKTINLENEGDLKLNGSLSGDIILSAGTTPISYTLTLPSTAGISDQALVTDGKGTCSWATPSNPKQYIQTFLYNSSSNTGPNSDWVRIDNYTGNSTPLSIQSRTSDFTNAVNYSGIKYTGASATVRLYYHFSLTSADSRFCLAVGQGNPTPTEPFNLLIGTNPSVYYYGIKSSSAVATFASTEVIISLEPNDSVILYGSVINSTTQTLYSGVFGAQVLFYN